MLAQFVRTHYQWSTTLEKGHVNVALLDFFKESDKVNHSVLLQ